ncbi:MAG TPA: hypothetical protein VMB52_06945 [Verrucomicrobiae bacterium]|nr:hypothetical protein [Verrucomicrobiae bacterium]
MGTLNQRQVVITRRQLMGLMAALAIEFVLGITLTSLINYQPNKHSTVQNVFLILHIVVALGILVGGIMRLLLAYKWQWLRIPSAIGLLSILGALFAGSVAANNGSDVGVFLMALFFLIAFASYGYSMGAVNTMTAKIKHV